MLRLLDDDVLLEIFDFYVDEAMGKDLEIQITMEWITLVHVCRRWRNVVFQSPRRLNLRLVCKPKTPLRDTMDIWPPFPLIIRDDDDELPPGVDNTIAALEHNDRVCQIDLICSYSRMQYVAESAAMQNPFPELTHLKLGMVNTNGPTLPDSFLCGTAPCLRSICLFRIIFPALPKLLLSTTHLINLDLCIPSMGYIPPETMAPCLSALTNLEFLRLDLSEIIEPDLERIHPPPPQVTRSVLPILTTMLFAGFSVYLEEILAIIDTPRLNKMHITFFDQFPYHTPQLFQFISRRPTLMALERDHIIICSGHALEFIVVKLSSKTSDLGVISVKIQCVVLGWQLLSLERLCTSLPPVYTMEDLHILEDKDSYSQEPWLDDVENSPWLRFLHPFTAVKNLYLCNKFVPRIGSTLEDLTGARTTDVFPILENIFLEGLQSSGPLHKGIETFVTARRLIGLPVAVSRWDKRDSEIDNNLYRSFMM